MSRAVVTVVSAVVLLLAAAGCGGSSAGRTPLIVDTDLSNDDIVALTYLTQDPNVRLVAVTVSGTGLVDCPVGARHTASLLAALDRADVPVACGRSYPGVGGNTVPVEWRRAADEMFGLTLPASPTRTRTDAAALLAEKIDSTKKPTLLALGPMTNLAQALHARPELAKKVGKVVAMAGAFTVPGNAPGAEEAETNVWADPAAARAVLAAGVPITFVPLDATNKVPVTTFVGQALKRYHVATPAATIVWDLVLASAMDSGGMYFWDPLAAMAVTHPELVPAQSRTVSISPSGRTRFAAAGAPAQVAANANRTSFERELLSTLLNGHPYLVPPHRVDATLVFTGSRCVYRGAESIVGGSVVLDSVNRSSTPFTWIAGRLDASHTLAELAAYARSARAATSPPPKWFQVDATGMTPPRSSMTWRTYWPPGTTGSTVVACVTASPPSAMLAAVVPVFGQG